MSKIKCPQIVNAYLIVRESSTGSAAVKPQGSVFKSFFGLFGRLRRAS